MRLRLILYAIGTLALVAGSVAAIADQSEKFTGVHEIVGVQKLPRFVSDRVELPPGIAPEGPVRGAEPGERARAPGGRSHPRT
jgi:hypothetical protein